MCTLTSPNGKKFWTTFYMSCMFCELEFIVYEYGDCDIEPIIGLFQFIFSTFR